MRVECMGAQIRCPRRSSYLGAGQEGLHRLQQAGAELAHPLGVPVSSVKRGTYAQQRGKNVGNEAREGDVGDYGWIK